MFKEIVLTNGKICVVDDDDFDYLSKFTWYENDGGYALTAIWDKKTKTSKYVRMHRIIMKCENSRKPFVDHINGNKLDNRKENLRFCDTQQNQFNSISSKGSSKYKGVSYCADRNKYYAYIMYNGKTISLGRHFTEEDAARAYNKKAKQLFGEFARLNDV